MLAARGALDTNRSTIEVMHGIGATDDQVARLFQRKIALDALTGGLAGGGGGGARPAAASPAAARRWIGDFAGGAAADARRPRCCSPLLPLAGTVLATLVARQAVLTRIAGRLMILRFGSLLLVLYGLGFVLFAVTLGKPAPAAGGKTDAHRRHHRRLGPHRAWRRGA